MNLSVVMAVRNGEPYVREAIESVLAQSVTDFEFLIVDDASTDNTPGILSEYQYRDSRVDVLHNSSHLGPYGSANRGLMRARGNVVARHDADDVSPPDRFAIQLEAIDSDDEISLVTGAVEVFDGNTGQVTSIIRPPSRQPKLEWELLFANPVGAGAHVMFPRVFRGAPILFPAEYPYAEDYGLWCGLSRLGRVASPAQTVYRYRQHGLSITSRNRVEQDECASKIRHEYQSQYLRSDASLEATAELSRFWSMADGSRPLDERACSIHSMFAEIRSNFLVHVEQRYGLSERALLEAEIDESLSDRLGYWLYRSVRFLDGMGCGDVLSIARAEREAVSVAGKALGEAARAILRRLSQTGALIAPGGDVTKEPGQEPCAGLVAHSR